MSVLKNNIYCDHNATTPLLAEISDQWQDIQALYGNASSVYEAGRKAKAALENSRALIAQTIGVGADQLIFTSSGTEANNHVIHSMWAHSQRIQHPVHIIISAIEHSSIFESAHSYQEFGLEVSVVPVNSVGEVNVADIESAIKPHTRLISVMMANNEIGTIQPIQEIAKLAKEHSIYCHSDMVQVLGKQPINVAELGVDFASFSAHKVYAPKGVGFLVCRDESVLSRLHHGGGHERRLRAGTENVPGIVALSHALASIDPQAVMAHDRECRDRFVQRLRADFDDIVIHTPLDRSLANTVSVAFPGCEGMDIVMGLDLAGISVSTGSACSVGSIDPSPVIRALGCDDDINKATVRFSFGMSNSVDDSDRIIDVLKAIVSRSRQAH